MIDIPDSIFLRNDKGELLCPKCKAVAKDCSCPTIDPPPAKKTRIQPHIRVERSGRKGKTVTLIQGLPADEACLHELTRALKIRTGSGGTCYVKDGAGVIEVQGDQRSSLETYFLKNPVFFK